MTAQLTPTRTLRLGTRRSALAIAQSTTVAKAITEHTGMPVELVEITTYGDVSREQVSELGGTGVFVNALREALVRGEIDLAVHSLKDLPTAPPKGISLAAVPPREDPRDVLVAAGGRRFADLAPGARLGTGSPRRAAQLLRHRPDLEFVPVRGNVDTRLRFVERGELDGVILAAAGLVRLGRLSDATEVFDPEFVLPAPGQGALAVECRAPDATSDIPDDVDAGLLALLRTLDDPASRAAALAERALLATLEGGCSAPVGAYGVTEPDTESTAQPAASKLRLTGVVVTTDGASSLRHSATGSLNEATTLGRDVATELLAQGAAGLMGECIP